MSAESKKKRGESGVTKAKNSPFRLNGRPPDWRARQLNCYVMGASPSCGSTTMRGLVGGVMADSLGFKMFGDYDRMMSHAQARCTHPLLADNENEPIQKA